MASEKPSSRREFLQGRAAARALVDRAQRAIESVAADPGKHKATESRVAHLHASRRAMACQFEVQYHATDGPESTDAMLAALDLIEALEDQLSIYRDHTEVAQLNRSAAVGPVAVERRLFQLLQLCEWLGESTSGAFDITSGPLSRVWGFLRREGRMPEQEELDAALQHVGCNLWRLDREAQSIEFERPGVEINLNSIGKGYALDRADELLHQRGIDNYLWHGGRSSVLARGVNEADPEKAWTVGIRHPIHADRRLAELHLRNQALGTAGSGTQHFEHEGRRYGHLIDPRTGWPAEGVATATAIAETAAEADALATAFYVLGAGATAEYCAAHTDVAALLVCPQEETMEFDVHAFNLKDADWTRIG